MTMPPLLAQAFPFVHPAIAGAALATGLIPIAVHLINRRRYVRVRWAAMPFLLAANRRSAKRIWFEQLLLMAVRVALIVLFGLAVARPYLPASSLLPLRTSRVQRVILLDNSLSMRARTSTGETRFAVARRAAHGLLESFPPTDAVSLITMSQPAEAVIAQPAFDRRFVRQQLAAVALSQRSTDTVGAIALASDLLASSPLAPGNRAVYLISDFPRRDWESDSRESPTDAVGALRRLADGLMNPGANLTLIRVASGVDDNVAVSHLATQTPLAGVGMPLRLVTRVTNHGSRRARGVELQVRRDGRIVRREHLPPLLAGASAETTVSVEFSRQGTHLIEVRLSGQYQDALSDDDVRYLSVEVRETAPLLLVDGRPGATRLAGQAGFLSTALSPRSDPGDATLLDPKTITAPELSGEALAEYDVVVLCNVHRLSAMTWKDLERFVSAGGGLLIFGGDLVSADNYSRFGYAEGSGLLPGRLAHATEPARADTRNGEHFGFRLDSRVHPIVAEFVGQPESGLFTARVERYLPIEIEPGRAQVVLRYSNGAVALVASSFGRGRVVLCTTTANMDWTNLPAKGDYVSLLHSTVAYLMPRRGDHRNVTVGRKIRERLSAAEVSMPLRVAVAGREAVEPALVADDEFLALEYGPIEQAGVVTVSIGSRVCTFTANVAAEESNLAVADEETLREQLGRPLRLVSLSGISTAGRDARAAVFGEPGQTRSTEFAWSLCLVVVALAVAETWMAMRFGAQRANPGRAVRAVAPYRTAAE